MKAKELDDVIGGKEAWDNAEQAEGYSHLADLI